MYKNSKKLKIGQRIRARIVELRGDRRLIVSIDGDLYGVRNSSQKKLSLGQHIDLVVTQVDPLQFSLFESKSKSFNRVI